MYVVNGCCVAVCRPVCRSCLLLGVTATQVFLVPASPGSVRYVTHRINGPRRSNDLPPIKKPHRRYLIAEHHHHQDNAPQRPLHLVPPHQPGNRPPTTSPPLPRHHPKRPPPQRPHPPHLPHQNRP